MTQRQAPDATFERLARRYVDEGTALAPVAATWLGDHRFDDRLDEVSPEARRQRADFCRGCLVELGRISTGELSRANRVDAAMLDHHLRAELWRLEELREWAWNPMAFTALAGGAIYSLMARQFAPLRDRLGCAAARLEQFPRMLRQVREVLDPPRVPRLHAETAAKQNRGVVGILDEMVRPGLEELPAARRKGLAAAIATARSAIEDHQRWIERELLPRSAGNFRLGAEMFDRKLALALNSPMPRGRLRRRAERELCRVRDEMYEIAVEVHRREHPRRRLPASPDPRRKQAVIRACLETACRQAPEPGRIVEAAEQSLAKLTAFVREDGVVAMPPDPVEIIVMPEFRRGTALAYCDSPGPLDVGQRTFYAISPTPADWTRRQVRSFLREYNLRSLDNLTAHEAMPGHFLQLSHSNRYPSTLRAMLASGVFVEGWAIYGEHLLVERGAYGDEPLMRLVVLKWLLRAVANAILDQAVHVDGMGEDEATRLLTEQTFQEEREAAGKWVRARLTSAQLSTYFVGYLEHVQLRREAEKAWGKAFDLRKYHDTVLSFGSPPPRFVRALMLDLPIDPA